MSARAELARLARALAAELERTAERGHGYLPRPAGRTPEQPVPAKERETTRSKAPRGASGPPTDVIAPASRASSSTPAAAQAPPPTAALAAAAPDLATLAREVAACRACSLCESRKQTVFADGPADGRARILFIGEAPGADEDEQGLPFVGRAGRLLTDIIEKGMGLARSEVYIANVLKCRPPGNRDPEAREKALCTPWLDRQIELVDPEILITLGRHASNHVLGRDETMGRLRGRIHRAKGRKVVATYHPAFLLRSPSMKKECWRDIQLAMREVGLAPPA